jgi:hypothetical protein
MLNATTVPAPFGAYRTRGDFGQVPTQARHRAVDEAMQTRLLARYVEGWAEADPVKIADATAPEYRFDDPFVGTFSILALPRYFEALKSRTGLGARAGWQHLNFFLSGPMDDRPQCDALWFWREAPNLGLTGTSLIAVGPSGVISERVAYDLNIASDQLCCPN